MKYQMRYRHEAELDIEDASKWYEQQLPGLGHDFLDNIESALQRIAVNPMMYPLVHRNTRRAIIDRFPFAIYYRIEQHVVLIVAVMHGSRHPQRWKTRQ